MVLHKIFVGSVGGALLMFTSAVTVHADTEHARHTWGAMVATGSLLSDDGPVRFWIEGQSRFNDGSSRFNQAIARTALGYVVAPRTTLWAGYAWIPTDPQGQPDNIVEHRIWQQLTWSRAAPLVDFSISTRTRLEQRVVEGAEDTGVRFRQLVKLTRPLAGAGRYYLSLWNELFVHLNDTDWGADGGLDQNRAFGGLGIRFNDTAAGEVGYMNQYVNRNSRSAASNHTLSLTLLLTY
jgi:hypothetical protein